MRIIKPVDERRHEILDGAIKLFSEKGYDKTSISDIAKYLGISQGLCYRYFKSKEEIFESAVDEYANSMADEMIKVLISSDLTIKDKIPDESSLYDLEKKNPYYKFFHGEDARLLHDCMSMSICRKVTPYVKAEIDKEVEKGRLKVTDSAMFASCCVYGQLGILLDADMSIKLRVRRINEFLLDMLEKYKA